MPLAAARQATTRHGRPTRTRRQPGLPSSRTRAVDPELERRSVPATSLECARPRVTLLPHRPPARYPVIIVSPSSRCCPTLRRPQPSSLLPLTRPVLPLGEHATARRARVKLPLLLRPPPAELRLPICVAQRRSTLPLHSPSLTKPSQAAPVPERRHRPAIGAAARAHRGAPTSGTPRSQLNPGTGPPRRGEALRPGLAHPHRRRAPPSRTEPPPAAKPPPPPLLDPNRPPR
jgi:hypothetical protein